MTKELKPVKYTTKDVTVPKDGLVLKTGNFWLCEDGDPARALFHGQTPQCNKDRRVAEWVLNGAYKAHDNLQIVFIDFAYVPPVDSIES